MTVENNNALAIIGVIILGMTAMIMGYDEAAYVTIGIIGGFLGSKIGPKV